MGEGDYFHLHHLYADEEEVEDEEGREEGTAAATPADSTPSSPPTLPSLPPSLSLLFVSALTSLSQGKGWRLYLFLFLTLVFVISTSLVVAYLTLARLLGASPLEGWGQGGKEGKGKKQECTLGAREGGREGGWVGGRGGVLYVLLWRGRDA